MYKILLPLLLLASLELSAYSDYDMDGVEDSSDQCQNTPLSDLVDTSGCTIKTLKSPHNFDIIIGMNFTQTAYDTLDKSDTTTASLQVDYYYKALSLQASTSYYDTQSVTYNESGSNDSFIGAYYKLMSTSNLNITLGAGAILATYMTTLNNNNTDYVASLSASYMLDNVNLFGGYSYTLVNDEDVGTDVIYQNSSSYNLGLGFYPTNRLYVSASYNNSESVYTNVDVIETASFYGYYKIDENWFTTLSYAYGLSDSASDSFTSLRLGYYF